MERGHFSQFPDPFGENEGLNRQGHRQHRPHGSPSTPEAGEVSVIKANSLAMEKARTIVEERECDLDEADRYGDRLIEFKKEGFIIVHNRPWR